MIQDLRCDWRCPFCQALCAPKWNCECGATAFLGVKLWDDPNVPEMCPPGGGRRKPMLRNTGNVVAAS